MFNTNDGNTTTIVTYEQFLDGLRRAKIPFPITMINDIMKHFVRLFFFIIKHIFFFCLYREEIMNKD